MIIPDYHNHATSHTKMAAEKIGKYFLKVSPFPFAVYLVTWYSPQILLMFPNSYFGAVFFLLLQSLLEDLQRFFCPKVLTKS